VGYNEQVFEGKFPPLTDLPKTWNGGHVSFSVGDKVIYPNHGLGVVEKVEEKTILGTTCGFFHLRILSNDTTVLVPVANVDNVGLRRAIDDDEVERLFGKLRRRQDRQSRELEGPVQDNSDKMRSGSIADMADVLKSLIPRRRRPLVREAYARSRQSLIVSEVSEVMRVTPLEIETRSRRRWSSASAPRPATRSAEARDTACP
jgi:CarD family transcriptional regulator